MWQSDPNRPLSSHSLKPIIKKRKMTLTDHLIILLIVSNDFLVWVTDTCVLGI